VICTYQRPSLLKRCLESILANNYGHYEVIIVGQGSDQTTKGIAEDFSRHYQAVQYVHSETVGLCPARNLGCLHAKGEIIAYIDDDAIASPQWIEGYAEIFQHVHPGPGMVGGRIEPLWETPKPNWYPAEREFLLGLYNIGDEVRLFPEPDLPVGANFAMPRRVIVGVGGFDERVGSSIRKKHTMTMITGDDSLMALRVKDAGYPIYYQPKSMVYHRINSTKLTKKYFLRRHYWEGVTHVTVEACRGISNRRRLRDHLLWNLKKMFMIGADLSQIYISRNKQRSSQVMLRLSEMVWSMGACIKVLELLIGNRLA
jgi:glycosyltransferase involved in cell wall biosynthesis